MNTRRSAAMSQLCCYHTAVQRRTGRCAAAGRLNVAMLIVVAMAACAGGPPSDQIGPPPGMETVSPGPATTPPGRDPTTASRGGMPTLEGTPDLTGKTPSGFVELREVEIAFLGAAGGGTGTLSFQGETYPFEIAGLGGGGAGIAKIDASGEVYDLPDVAQFPGAYDERRLGVAFGGGGGGELWLQNNAGVIMHLKAGSEGLMLSLGGDVVEIRMSQ